MFDDTREFGPSLPQITDRQVGKIMLLCRDLNITDRATRLEQISAYLYRPVGSLNELDRDSASLVIDWLLRRTKGQDVK